MKQTEQIQLKRTPELATLCHLAKNLYNEANYRIRQEFFQTGRWMRYEELDILLKKSDNYRALPIATSQQLLRVLDKNWKSYFKAIKDWRKHPEKYRGRPKIPKYKKKSGESLVIFTNQQCKIRHGYLEFPSRANLKAIRTRIVNKLRQIRIIPRGLSYVLEIIYEKEPVRLALDRKRVLGIDLGLRNLVTCVNNIGLTPFVIKGGVVKSINQFYNKQKAHLQSIKDLQHCKFETKRLQRLTLKRNNKIKDYLHKTSKAIINFCIENNLGTILIGYNSGWKQEIELGKRNNQNFVNVPFLKLIQQLHYKAELVGIEIKTDGEDHTSKCSFLDGEPIIHHDTYMGKRISRGLFKSKNGKIINADVNGGYNIIKKAVPKAFANGISINDYGIE